MGHEPADKDELAVLLEEGRKLVVCEGRTGAPHPQVTVFMHDKKLVRTGLCELCNARYSSFIRLP